MEPSNRQRCIESTIHLFGLDTGSEQLSRNGETSRARVAEPKAARIREHCDVQSFRNLRRNLNTTRNCNVVDELARRTRSDVSEHVLRWRFITRDVMVDDNFRNRKLSHRISERSQSLYICDVQHDEQIDISKGRWSLIGFIRDISRSEEHTSE